MGAGAHERMLALVRDWPRDQEKDLAYANWAGLAGGRSANGYDPMVPLAHARRPGRDGRRGHAPGRVLPLRARRGWRSLGVRWVQVPATSLAAPRIGFAGDPVDLRLDAGAPALLPAAHHARHRDPGRLPPLRCRRGGPGRRGRAGRGAAGHRTQLRAQPARGGGHRGVVLGAAGRAVARRAPARRPSSELDGSGRRLRRATATSAACGCPAATSWTA